MPLDHLTDPGFPIMHPEAIRRNQEAEMQQQTERMLAQEFAVLNKQKGAFSLEKKKLRSRLARFVQ